MCANKYTVKFRPSCVLLVYILCTCVCVWVGGGSHQKRKSVRMVLRVVRRDRSVHRRGWLRPCGPPPFRRHLGRRHSPLNRADLLAVRQRRCLCLVFPLPSLRRHRLCFVFPLPSWPRHRLCPVFALPSLRRHCLPVPCVPTAFVAKTLRCLVFPPPSLLRHCLSLRSSGPSNPGTSLSPQCSAATAWPAAGRSSTRAGFAVATGPAAGAGPTARSSGWTWPDRTVP